MTDKTDSTPAQPMSAREYRLTRKSPAHRSDTIDEFAEAYAAHVLSTYQGIRDRLETSLRQQLTAKEAEIANLIRYSEHYSGTEDAIESLTSRAETAEAEVARLREALDKLRTIGAQMANLCFNLKQGATAFTERERVICGELQTEWDAARAALAKDGK